jgi:TonB family protein
MGRISEYDHKRNKRLLVILPISIVLLFVLAISVDHSHIIDKIFYIGYEGPPNYVPEITIIDEKSIESDVSRQERHTSVAENVILDSDRLDESKNPDEVTSTVLDKKLREPSLADQGADVYRSYASHADVPYRENYVILKMVKPEYPPDALALGIEGYVLVEAYVITDGTVAEAWVQSAFGPKSFERESLHAVRQFQFKPAMEEGKPIPFWVSFLIRFEISAMDLR